MQTLTTITNERRANDGVASDIDKKAALAVAPSEAEFIKLLSTLSEGERAAVLAYIEREVRQNTTVTI